MPYVTTSSFRGFGADETQAALDASAEAAALSIDPTKGTKYKTAKAAALWSGQQLNQAVELFQKTQAGKVVVAGSNMTELALSMVTNAKAGKYKADAGGVVNFAMDTARFLNSFEALGAQIGGSAGAVVAEISSWGQVAAGCAAGLATGPWGAIGCGLGFLNKIFGLFAGTPPPYAAANWVVRTLFKPRNTAMPYIARDTIRLGQVLTHWYGIQTYKTLLNKLSIDTFTWMGNYPEKPDIVDGQKLGAKKPIPGHNLYTALHMLSGPQLPQYAHASIDNALTFLAAIRGRAGMEGPGAGRQLYMRYVVDNDISVDAIAHGAYIGRSAIAKQGIALLNCSINAKDGSRSHIQRFLEGYIFKILAGEESLTLLCDFTPFILLDELLNFFGAVTLREVKSEGARAFIDNYGLGNDLPLAHIYVHDSDRSGKPPQDGGVSPEFEAEPNCRTNLLRNPSECGTWNDVLIATPPPTSTLRETAAVRLCAALSYAHMQYRWSGSAEPYRKDPFLAIEPINKADPTHEMRLPVDPRQILPTANVIPIGMNKARVYTLRTPDESPESSTPVELFRRDTINATSHTSAVIPTPKLAGGDNFTPARTTPEVLKQRIDAHEQIVQQAIAKARSASPSTLLPPGAHPDGYVLSTEEVKALQAQAAKVSSGISPFQPLVKPIDLVNVHGQSVLKPKTSLATPLLVGAAALLALKFLK